jgi:hypothetical protein
MTAVLIIVGIESIANTKYVKNSVAESFAISHFLMESPPAWPITLFV